MRVWRPVITHYSRFSITRISRRMRIYSTYIFSSIYLKHNLKTIWRAKNKIQTIEVFDLQIFELSKRINCIIFSLVNRRRTATTRNGRRKQRRRCGGTNAISAAATETIQRAHHRPPWTAFVVVVAVVLVRKPVAGNSGGRCRRRVVRGRGLVSALRERGASPDGRTRRQRGVHIHAVRGRAGRRLCSRHGGRPPAAARHDGGRHRSPKLRPVHRHRQLVRPPGGNYAVMTSVRLLFYLNIHLIPSVLELSSQ